jgi:hypothetical protein
LPSAAAAPAASEAVPTAASGARMVASSCNAPAALTATAAAVEGTQGFSTLGVPAPAASLTSASSVLPAGAAVALSALGEVPGGSDMPGGVAACEGGEGVATLGTAASISTTSITAVQANDGAGTLGCCTLPSAAPHASTMATGAPSTASAPCPIKCPRGSIVTAHTCVGELATAVKTAPMAAAAAGCGDADAGCCATCPMAPPSDAAAPSLWAGKPQQSPLGDITGLM